MLLTVFLVLWVAVLASAAAAYGVRPTARSRTEPWPRWVWLACAIAALCLVVVIPVLSLNYSSGERERQSKTGLVLTDEQVEGRNVFSSACKRCHTLADVNAVSTIGPNLDLLQPSYDLTYHAVINGRARGKGQMPAGLVGAEGASAVASYLEAVAGRDRAR